MIAACWFDRPGAVLNYVRVAWQRAVYWTLLQLLLLSVSGCAWFGGDAGSGRPVATAPALNPHRSAVIDFDPWRLGGKVAVQRGDTGFSGALQWRQRQEAFDLRISAPLNGGTFALQRDESGVELLTPSGDRYQAAHPEQLMSDHLGWTLPVDGAAFWIRGVPAPGSEATAQRLDSAGRWTDFAQDGWRVSVLDYFDDTEPSLPRKLFLTHNDLRIKVVVKQWQRQ